MPRPRFLHVFCAALFSCLPAGLRAAPPNLASRQAPEWAVDAVWYQIFPDRFRNGDPRNDPPRSSLETPVMAGTDWRVSSWTADWFSRDDWEKALGPNFYNDGVFDRRYGGDLQGVLDKLDYVKSLGVNALYFNPLFYARSLHKYDGSSYHHIDPYFGPDPAGDLRLMARETSDPASWQWTAADRLFLQVVREAHARGMKVIIDGVFNHTGRDFFAFKNLTEKQDASPYKDWYAVTSFDDPNTVRNEFVYKGWWGHRTLPVFASTKDGLDFAPGPKKYIMDSTRRWMVPDGNPALGVDGWRLDVADERPNKFWAEWNAFVRKLNPLAYTTAETWNDPRPLIVDGGFSATMNYYGFAIPVKGWLADAHLSPSRFARQLDARRDALPVADAYVMQNLMDSHDTDRLASMVVNGEGTHYDRPDQDVSYNNDNDLRKASGYLIRKPNDRERALQRLIVFMQMTYVGAPMIYYGDEVGMWGAHDPDNRQPMVWADLKYASQTHDPRTTAEQPPQPVAVDQELFDYYHDAIALRRSHEALRRGDYTVVATDDEAGVLAFKRQTAGENLLVALNRSDVARTVTLLRLPISVDRASWFTRPTVLFVTPGAASPPEVQADGDSLKITVPPLAGVVIGNAR